MEYFITQISAQGTVKTGPLTPDEAFRYVEALLGTTEPEPIIHDLNGTEVYWFDLLAVVLESEEYEGADGFV